MRPVGRGCLRSPKARRAEFPAPAAPSQIVTPLGILSGSQVPVSLETAVGRPPGRAPEVVAAFTLWVSSLCR